MLTKSNYMIGLQCPRYFWISVNDKQSLPKHDAVTQFRFDQGHELEKYAHKLFNGTLIPSNDFMGNIRKAKELLNNKQTVFEAGIRYKDLYARADILENKGNEYDVIEIKSSTKVKPEYILDVAFQKYVYEKAGLKINKCYLMHINNKYIKNGEIKPEELLIKQDITEEVNKEIKNVPTNIEKLREILKLKEPPEFQIEDIDNSFYGNPIIDEFKESLPKGSVFELYRGGKKCNELFGKKICQLSDIPENVKLTPSQKIQKEVAKTNKPHINKEKIKEFLSTLQHPLYYLDFETFQTAVPLFDGTKSYQQIPFQYSLHIVNKETKHIEFLADKKDARKEFLESLKENLGTEGSIIVYNKSFEIGRLRELGEYFNEMDWVNKIEKRIVDLIEPFRKFYYYNQKQNGSASIKYVLPAITGKDYSKLEINNGADASLQFYNMMFNNGPDVRDQLLKYCEMDTKAMLLIIDKLEKL